MVARKPKGKYTYADYAATPDDERWELIDGELYRMASGASTKHQLVTLEFGGAPQGERTPQDPGMDLHRAVRRDPVGH